MFASRLATLAGSGRSLVQKAIAILQKYGTNAHVYLPGIGVINGLQAANYLDYTETIGSEQLTSPTFAAATGWTQGSGWMIASNMATATTANGALTQTALVLGQYDQVQITTTAASAGNFDVLLGGVKLTTISTVGTFTVRGTAGGTTLSLQGNGYTGVLTLASVKSVTGASVTLAGVDQTIGQVVDSKGGINAFQATSGNRPTLRRGLVNILKSSHNLASADYFPAAMTLTQPTIILPSGISGTVNLLTPTTASAIHQFGHNAFAVQSGTIYTHVTVAKAAGYRYLYVNGISSSGQGQVTFDLQTGTLINGNSIATSIVSLGNGWYMCYLTASSNNTSALPYYQINNSFVAADTTFAADGTSGIYIQSCGLFVGNVTPTEIPLTTTAPASSSTGNYSLEFNGTTNYLQMAQPLFQMSDDQAVIAGFSKSNLSSYGGIVSPSNNPLTFAKQCSLGIDYPGSNNLKAAWTSDTPADYNTSTYALTTNIPVVATAYKLGSAGFFRVNGGQVGGSVNLSRLTSSTVTQGTIGQDSKNSGYHTGSIYPIIALKNPTLADVQVLEKLVGMLTGPSGVYF